MRVDNFKLVDEEGENLAVRAFLMLYGGDPSNKSVGSMRRHMELSGFKGLWPGWVEKSAPSSHLTKAGAQLWIRHLFSLETKE